MKTGEGKVYFCTFVISALHWLNCKLHAATALSQRKPPGILYSDSMAKILHYFSYSLRLTTWVSWAWKWICWQPANRVIASQETAYEQLRQLIIRTRQSEETACTDTVKYTVRKLVGTIEYYKQCGGHQRRLYNNNNNPASNKLGMKVWSGLNWLITEHSGNWCTHTVTNLRVS
jgi:hypothetical protein